MTKPEGRMNFAKSVVLFVILISSFVITSIAQEDTPPPDKRGVQLMFVPPPMQGGTISLGIYDPAGKLIRILHQEAQTSDFFAALNGFITYWDGKDDTGKLMPAGKYIARGYMVGPMDFEGVAFLCNDFIGEDGVGRIRHISGLVATTKGGFGVTENAGGSTHALYFDANGKSIVNESSSPDSSPAGVMPSSKYSVEDGKIYIAGDGSHSAVNMPGVEKPVAICNGLNNTLWVIDGTDIKQISPDGQVLRHLAAKVGEPMPVQIAASPTTDEIYLLEQNATSQRVRALVLDQAAGTGGESVWKVVFQKSLRSCDTLDQVRDLLKTPSGKPFTPQDKIRLTLLPNPLEQDKLGAVDISIGIDAKGSFLKAGDGLPLCRVSETPNLRWAAMSGEPGSKVITIFQSDGAVVEQFKAGKLANMMSFDCGDFDFDPAKVK